MTNKQALREAAEKAAGAYERLSIMPADDIFDISQHEGTQLDADITALNAFNESANPGAVLALLDELEAKDRKILKLEKLAEAESVGADKAAASGVEWMKLYHAAEKRIAELSHHLQCAHAFIEHTEAFGHAASNGILCCGDAQWNIDESKSALAAAGK